MTWYEESAVAEKIGVTREAVKKFRDKALREKVDWEKKGRAIELNEIGVKKLLFEFHIDDLDLSSVGKNGAADPVELEVLIVYPNPRLLLARTADGEQVRVQVMSNANFRRGMKLKARAPVPGDQYPQLYRLEGRTPRWPGQW